ncbi:MAG: PAS domain-containing sensor histidine kinase [Lachnospiraceae bacterium]|nr:PAS domain-containing sensor histidine kinase [Lachnospiraceae bacterium]
MSRKIFLSIWLVTLSVLLVCLTIVLAVVYNYFTEEQLQQLRNETQLVTQGVTLNGTEYLTDLDTSDFRVTLMTADGTILYDTEADQTVMENHLEREEIRQALSEGYGESHRYSSTLSERQIYAAKRLSDGTILRLSITQASILHLFTRFFLQILGVIVVALVLSGVLASRLSSRIMEPINMVNLDDPISVLDNPAYEEIRPLLVRLNDQHKQIEHDREEIEKTALIRQEFTANASHELKSPLHVISGYAELLQSGMVTGEDQQMLAGKIRQEAERMTNLVEDIIDLSRLDSGAVGMDREATDLYRIAGNAVESLDQMAVDAGVSVTLRGERALVSGIPQVLYSMVYNVCMNAIKYSNLGGSVLVTVRNFEGSVILSVQDNGIGIPKEDLSRIFERFYRVDKSHSKEVGGTGLGLSIVKHGAKIHDAEIAVESEVGRGTTFTFTFPGVQ